jgi:4-hydroxy-tetrahydrodipicolinate synthase
MTGFAFPEILIAMLNAMKAKDVEQAFDIYRQYLPLIVFEQQAGVAVRKEIYRMRGLLRSSQVRHPGSPMDKETGRQLVALLERMFPRIDVSKPIAIE